MPIPGHLVRALEEGKKQGVFRDGEGDVGAGDRVERVEQGAKVSGRKRVLKSWRRAENTRTGYRVTALQVTEAGYRVQGQGAGRRFSPEGRCRVNQLVESVSDQ